MENTITQEAKSSDMSPGIAKLALALSKAQGEMNGAIKDSKNDFFKSKYADLHQCILAAKGPLAANELAVIQTTRNDGGNVVIITTLAHSSGEWIRGELCMKPKKDDDQSRGSSITYGRRYAYAAIIGLAQKDDDGNAACEEKTQHQHKPEDRTSVDQWLAWVDKYTDATLDIWADDWTRYGVAALKSMSDDHRRELEVAAKEMNKYLTEKEVQK